MIKIAKTNRGFTLLETLITITIIGGVGVLITQVFFTTTRVNTKSEIIKEVKQNGQFALDVMTRTIRNAEEVDSVCSPGGTSHESLQITNKNGDTTVYGCVYDASEGITRIASTSGLSARSDFITSQNVTIGGTNSCDASVSLRFTCTENSGGFKIVRIDFTLAQKGTPPDQFEKASEAFATSVTLRN